MTKNENAIKHSTNENERAVNDKSFLTAGQVLSMGIDFGSFLLRMMNVLAFASTNSSGSSNTNVQTHHDMHEMYAYASIFAALPPPVKGSTRKSFEQFSATSSFVNDDNLVKRN